MIQKNTMSMNDVEAMKAEFFARGGKIQVCKPHNLGSKMLQNGVLRDAQRKVTQENTVH
jgi:hypothetical protein